ncbi:hypothetical protein AAVH_09433 [Aphelenchoides avenae]|nr:hypothetical protein AAVH_09433 [Aphelenchus avenae]
MSSLPSEVLEDVLQPLDRWTLDTVQFTDGRFLQLILERMTNVCLRQVHRASFMVGNENMEESFYGIYRYGRPLENYDNNGWPGQEIWNTHKDTARLFSEFVQALQSSCVADLALERLVFTPDLAALVRQAPIVVGNFSLVHGSCAELTPTQFHEVILHFSPTSLDFNNSHLHPCHITNAFLRPLSLRALNKDRMLRAVFPRKVPVDGGSFCATDDAVVDFCKQPDVEVGQEEDAPKNKKKKAYAELTLYHGRFTKGLFKRLVEACYLSKRTQPLRIFVSPVRIEEEDLHDFAQHLVSRRNAGTVYQLRIYDFYEHDDDEQDVGMHVQIALHSENDGLELILARGPNLLFYESDEE